MRSLAPVLVLFAAVSCGPPKNAAPIDQIPKLTKLSEVMDAQATTADPQMKKRDQATFTEGEFAELAETARRIDATSKHIKDFSKGPAFDALADRLNQNAASLGKAAESKDAAAARSALSAMKATCAECHDKFR